MSVLAHQNLKPQNPTINVLPIPNKPLWAPAESKLEVPKCFTGWDNLDGKDKNLIVKILKKKYLNLEK